MNKFLLGRKIGMTQIMDEDGKVVPVTVIQVEPNTIVKRLNSEANGYDALLLGVGELKERHVNKPTKGFFEKEKAEPKKVLKEFRLSSADQYADAKELTVDLFDEKEKVSVASKSIGRGFAGTIKRHNFRRGPMTHGSKSHRITGSIGGGTYPGRVFKGKKMAGHYGNSRVTVKNLVVVRVDKDRGLLLLKGSVPGKKNNLVEIFN